VYFVNYIEIIIELAYNNIQIKITQSIKANISDYTVIQSLYQDGEYFVKISYENIPSLDKLASLVPMKSLLMMKDIKILINYLSF
jgi:hypothetical protein